MIKVTRHSDVARFEMSNRRSRLLGYSVSAYLVRGVLVDCGFPAIGGEVTQLLDTNRLRGVVITHSHEDHAGNIDLVAGRGFPIAAHAGALRATRESKPLLLYRRFTWGVPLPLRSPVTPLEMDDLELLETPGHSDDHVVIWDPETRTVIAGDLFLGVKVRVAHATENPRLLVESLRRVAGLDPLRLFDGHRGLVTDVAGHLRAKADWTEEIVTRVDQLADEHDASDEEIARRVLGRPGRVDFISQGEYSRRNLVRAIRRTRAVQPARATVT